MRDPRFQAEDTPTAVENNSSAMNSSTTFGMGSRPSLNHALKRKLGMAKRSGDEA